MTGIQKKPEQTRRKRPKNMRGSIRQNSGAWRPIVDVTDVYPGTRGIDRRGVYNLYDAPIGVHLKVEEAVKAGPLLEAEMEWETEGISPLYMWQEDQRYHMLYGASPNGACYAVSEDAYHWTRPEMGWIEFNGSKKNNIIHKELQGSQGFFEDPSAPPEERFKTMGGGIRGWLDPDTNEPLSVDEALKRAEAMQYQGAAYNGPRAVTGGKTVGLTSPDRLHWKQMEEPLADRKVNGAISACYDPHNGEYYAYLQIMGFPAEEPKAIGTASVEEETQLRTIGLSRTKDFRRWPAPKLIIEPDAQDDLDIDFYGANYFPYPGHSDLHGMLIPVFHRTTDHMDGQIAFSHDGLYWSRPERRAIITVGAPGSGDDCMVHFWRAGILELPDGYWGTPYTGASRLHTVSDEYADALFPSRRPTDIRWARWRPHRFCGVEADIEGRFTIPTLYRHHDQLKLNYRCKPGGWISVELIQATPGIRPDVDGLSKFTFAECDWLTGDREDQAVTWKGRSDISGIGETIVIRLKMFQAKLFAYQV